MFVFSLGQVGLPPDRLAAATSDVEALSVLVDELLERWERFIVCLALDIVESQEAVLLRVLESHFELRYGYRCNVTECDTMLLCAAYN